MASFRICSHLVHQAIQFHAPSELLHWYHIIYCIGMQDNCCLKKAQTFKTVIKLIFLHGKYLKFYSFKTYQIMLFCCKFSSGSSNRTLQCQSTTTHNIRDQGRKFGLSFGRDTSPPTDTGKNKSSHWIMLTKKILY